MRKLALIIAAAAALAGCVHHPSYHDNYRYDRDYYGYRNHDYGDYYDRSYHRRDRDRHGWDRHDRYYGDNWRWDH